MAEQADLEKKLLTDGYITGKDDPDIDNEDKGNALTKKLDGALHKEEKDPYIQYELFDFQKGIIKGIIFNMDIIKTRDEAATKLSEVTGLKEIKITLKAEEEINEIGKA